MEQKTYTTKDYEDRPIELSSFWRVFLQNIWILVLAGLLAAVLAGAHCHFATTSYYTADAKFLISGMKLTAVDGEMLYVPDITSGSTNGAAFAENTPAMIAGNRTTEKVLGVLQDKDPDRYADLTGGAIGTMWKITVEKQIVTVSVHHRDPQTVMDVAAALMDILPAQLETYYGIDGTYTEDRVVGVATPLNHVTEEDLRYVGPDTFRVALIAGLITALAVYAILWIGTYVGRRIDSETDLTRNFTLPVIGCIPVQKKSVPPSPHDLWHHRAPYTVAVAYERLRTRFLHSENEEKTRVCGVTSPTVDPDKAWVTAHLAVSLAMIGQKVLLVDADLRCPAQQEIFHVAASTRGLSDLLAAACSYEELDVLNGDCPTLRMLPAGTHRQNPAELLASDGMKQFLSRAREEYDVILLDLPPVLEVSDAGIVSNLVTDMILTVRAEKTDCRTVAASLDALATFKAPVKGFVLSNVSVGGNRFYEHSYTKQISASCKDASDD